MAPSLMTRGSTELVPPAVHPSGARRCGGLPRRRLQAWVGQVAAEQLWALVVAQLAELMVRPSTPDGHPGVSSTRAARSWLKCPFAGLS